MMRPAAYVFFHAFLILLCLLTQAYAKTNDNLSRVLVKSPNKKLTATVALNNSSQVVFSLSRGRTVLIEPSPVGILLDDIDAGAPLEIVEPRRRQILEAYATRGAHAFATNLCEVAEIPLRHARSGLEYKLEVRVFDDGAAYRYVVPGNGTRTIRGELSSWTLPERSQIWYSERDSDWKLKTYAGEWRRAGVEQMVNVSKQGPVQCAPLVVETPDAGLLVLTEAAVFRYSGMRLRAVGNRTFQADFTEGAKGFALSGEIVSPWRVTIVPRDLDGLVNNDVLASLCLGPDPELFRDRSWIKPGRAAWRWWSRGTGSFLEERDIVDTAAKLGFEYTIVDEGWQEWPNSWDSVRALCTHAKNKGVGVFLWKHYNQVCDPAANWAQLTQFLDRAAEAGASGVKLDFLNGESLDRVLFEEAALRIAAERKLLVNFHGCRKPGGESRTYPNEVTREAVRGLELNKMKEGPITPSHNAALPFTRFAVGHADYTPVGFSNPGGTSFAHQAATMVLFTSALQVIAEDPEQLLNRKDIMPALAFLREIPATWDETRVLKPSAIGDVAVMARRCGDKWFLAAVNGANGARKLKALDLSFLGGRKYHARILQSFDAASLEVTTWKTVTRNTRGDLELRGGDGFVALFEPVKK